MTNIKGKKILLLAPKWFGYEIEIKNKLEELGANVVYFDERPGNKFVTKALIRINKKTIALKTIKYYETIIKSIEGLAFDYVLVVNTEALTSRILEKIKEKQTKAKYLLYMWDSVLNKKNTLEVLGYFDKTFSFEKKDCQEVNRLQFLPLFYLDCYKDSKESLRSHLYDFCFIGTIHSDRYTILKELQKKYSENNWFLYMFFPSRILFYRKKLMDISFKSASIKEFNFKPLSQIQTSDVILSSKIIIDIQHPNQEGLTIRTIESVGAKRKLVTTNKNISSYNFYNSNNVLVIDRTNPVIPKEFIKTEYQPLPVEVYNEYSIDSWISSIFSGYE